MTKTRTIQEVASEAAGWFEGARREDDSTFVRTRDGAPEWVTHLVREAHGDFLPDDWRYSVLRDALFVIEESGDDDDARTEFLDGCVDVYTSDRIAWLATHLYRVSYCDEAAEEGLVAQDAGIVERIGAGQYMEASEVFGLVLAFLERASKEA